MSDDATPEIRRLNAQLEGRVTQLTAALEVKARELRDSEERFRHAMEVSHEGFWDWNIKTDAFYCNPGLAEKLDYDPAELSRYTARMWQELLPPDERAAVVASIERDLRDLGHFEIEFTLRSKHGAYRWILSRGKVVERDADGAPLRAVGTHADIEERKQADTLNRRLASIIEASSDLIAAATPEGRVDYMNQAGRALLGIGATEPLEQTGIEDCHPAWAYRRVAEEGIPAALAQGRWLGDTAMLRRDGRPPDTGRGRQRKRCGRAGAAAGDDGAPAPHRSGRPGIRQSGGSVPARVDAAGHRHARLNGYDACRRIRAEPSGQGMVIVALTGWGQDQDKEKSRAAGFDQHLVKPIDSAGLERLLNGLQRETGA